MTITNIEKDKYIYYTKCTCTKCNCKFTVEGTYKEFQSEVIGCPNCNRSTSIIIWHLRKKKLKKGKEENVK